MAYWIQRTHFFDPDEYECSECGAMFARKSLICPACGAPMHGAKKDSGWVDEAAYLDIIMDD